MSLYCRLCCVEVVPACSNCSTVYDVDAIADIAESALDERDQLRSDLATAKELIGFHERRIAENDAREDDARLVCERFVERVEHLPSALSGRERKWYEAARRFLSGDPSKVKAECDEAVALLQRCKEDACIAVTDADIARDIDAFLARVGAK